MGVEGKKCRTCLLFTCGKHEETKKRKFSFTAWSLRVKSLLTTLLSRHLRPFCVSLTHQPFVTKASEGTEQKETESSPGSRMLIGRFVHAGQGDSSPLEQKIRSSQGIRGGVSSRLSPMERPPRNETRDTVNK